MYKTSFMAAGFSLMAIAWQLSEKFSVVFSLFLLLMIGIWSIYFVSAKWNFITGNEKAARLASGVSSLLLLFLVLPKVIVAEKQINIEAVLLGLSLFLLIAGMPNKGREFE